MDDKIYLFVIVLCDEDFMFEFSHLEVHKGHCHINIYTMKGLISKEKSPMHDPKNPPLCTNGRMNWPSGHSGIIWGTFEVKRLLFWGIHRIILNSKLNNGLRIKDTRPMFGPIYPPLFADKIENWFSCHIGSFDIMWGKFIIKKLSFKDIFGLLYKKINENGSKLRK